VPRIANTTTDTVPSRKIEYLSPPTEVNMGDRWFEIASGDHFWVRRRFEVLQQLAGDLITTATEIAEVGCGHGLLQRQIEDKYGRKVVGFDLNEYALKQNVSRRSEIYCYDILRMDTRFRSSFDVIFLFDVLEHISREDGFLEALLFHLDLRGKLVLNVPAGQWAHSEYDQAAGHMRRYSICTLQKAAARSRLRVQAWTYWGLPLIPALMLRKLWLMGKRDKREVISGGFDSRATAVNTFLGLASRCEIIPQKVLGSSLMAILQRSEI